jgi:hypothetical protein
MSLQQQQQQQQQQLHRKVVKNLQHLALVEQMLH